MSDDRLRRLNLKIEEALRHPAKGAALYRAVKRGRDSRAAAVAQLHGGENFRDEVRAVKLRCLEEQPDLVERFAAKVRERGAEVFLAEDGAAAIEFVLGVARRHGSRLVAKSKSLTTEEIEINHPLEAAGMRVIETDLGELIIQEVGEKPFHLVFPAVHKTADEVAEIFRKTTGQEIPNDVDGIMRAVRQYLRPIFLSADIGMTGANVGIAENGAIVIETNEGNARLVSSLPDVHICIMGREKIVETIEDALKMTLAHPLSAVGQLLTTYVTWMGGRSPLGTGPGRRPRKSYIVILDNGRTRMREDPLFQDALNCIRCGACMNICPTYGVVGGHAFGYIYPGPIGIPWTAEVHGLEKAGDFASLCISCGLCKEICPAEIDIPMMIAAVKDRDSEAHPHPLVNRTLMAAERLARVGSATAPVSNWFLRNAPFRWVMEKTIGIDRRRELPPFSRRPLARLMDNRVSNATAPPRRRVAYFADLYANYNSSELGLRAVELLESLGCEVIFPSQKGCGYPYIGYGDLKSARRIALENVRALAPLAAQGFDIVTTEPTAGYCLRMVYPKLLDGSEEARMVASKCLEYFALLEALEEPDGIGPRRRLEGRKFGFHVSCHQRPLGGGSDAIRYLRRRGAEVELIETGTCCGMAGTFGLKKGPLGYELAQAVGAPLFQAFAESGVEAILTESSVCSIHLKEGTGLPLLHPIELLSQECLTRSR